MATTIASTRTVANQRVLTYPNGYPSGGDGCIGCRGIKGDCVQAIASQQDVVSFTLADGRTGVVFVAPGASAAVVTAAIQAWATAQPLVASALTGTVIA